MPWAYLDDGFPEHPKVIAAGGDAAWMFVAALCWSRRHMTGGDIPKAILGRLTDRKKPASLAGRLVDVGLWNDKGDHYAIHDYDVWNHSEEAAKERRRERALKGAKARWSKAPSTSSSNAQASAQAMPDPMLGDAPCVRGRAAPSPSPTPISQSGLSLATEGPPPAEPRQTEHTPKPPPPQVLDHIATTIGWTTPAKRNQLAAAWNHGATHLDPTHLEDTLLRCTNATNISYLQAAIDNAITQTRKGN